jgi:hypothetical protein
MARVRSLGVVIEFTPDEKKPPQVIMTAFTVLKRFDVMALTSRLAEAAKKYFVQSG